MTDQEIVVWEGSIDHIQVVKTEAANAANNKDSETWLFFISQGMFSFSDPSVMHAYKNTHGKIIDMFTSAGIEPNEEDIILPSQIEEKQGDKDLINLFTTGAMDDDPKNYKFGFIFGNIPFDENGSEYIAVRKGKPVKRHDDTYVIQKSVDVAVLVMWHKALKRWVPTNGTNSLEEALVKEKDELIHNKRWIKLDDEEPEELPEENPEDGEQASGKED